MKIKRIFFIIALGVVITVLALVIPRNSISVKNTGLIGSAEEAKRIEIEKNIELYQPKQTEKTSEGDIGVNAQSAIVFDQGTGEILYEKNGHDKLAPASITKMATYSVAVENLDINQLIEVSQKAADQEPNKIVMKTGEKMHLKDLLYGLMMISANDAAYAIAEAIPGSYNAFISKMNDLSTKLGLKDTHFENPSGLDGEAHFSTAFDIATFTRYALTKHPEVVQYAGEKKDYSVFPSDHNESHWWGHISGMLYRYPGMIAAKTGYTDIAHSTFVGIAERDGRRLVVVFLNSTDANADVVKLLDYGFAH